MVYTELTDIMNKCFTGSLSALCSYSSVPVDVSPAPTPFGQTVTSLDQCKTVMGISNGDNCLAEFVYKGVTYTDCTDADDERKWCYTMDNNGASFLWGYCGECNIV